MSTKTEILKLTKPDATDIVDISAINENMDIIDENIVAKVDLYKIKKDLDDSDASIRAEMKTIKKNLDDSDASLKSGYESADATLRSDYEAADASIRTDLHIATERIDNLVANTGDSNSEIVDARVGYDGTTYGSLGKAIRKQFEGFKEENLELDKKISSLRLYRDDEGYLCETEE